VTTARSASFWWCSFRACSLPCPTIVSPRPTTVRVLRN
jgi:hypothetical protein